MSKKKWRTPPKPRPEQPKRFSGADIRNRVLERNDPEELQRYIDEGWRIYNLMNARCGGLELAGGPLTDAEAERALATCVGFLGQLVQMTGRVLESVDTRELRRIIAGDLKVPDSFRLCLEAAGISLDAVIDNEAVSAPSEDLAEDPKKRPRGPRHPLLVLFQLAVQACRLTDRITLKTNPGVHNQPPWQDKLAHERELAGTRAFGRA